MTSIPRLTFVGARAEDDPTSVVLGFARACRQAGARLAIAVIGADRETPNSDVTLAYAEATGHAVHRLDPRMMTTPSLQRVVTRASNSVDVVLVVAHGGLEQPSLLADFVDTQHALRAPVVICEHTEGTAVARKVVAVLKKHTPEQDEEVLPAPRMLPLDGTTEYGPLRAEAFETLLAFADTAPSMPPPVRHRRIGSRARIGLVIDECFDLYDEEGLVQLEVAGAELVPLTVLGRSSQRSASDIAEDWDTELDGLLIGDGHVERHSVDLARSRRSRERVRAIVGLGTPTLACGGGYAYLTRGLRTGAGALHPLAGVIDAESVVTGGTLPRGHVEISTRRDSLIGAEGSRVRGYVQRSWLTRGTHASGRSVYSTLSGPPDDGYASGNILALHFRPYWPSCAEGIESFVDRCVSFAAAREFGVRGSAAASGRQGPAKPADGAA